MLTDKAKTDFEAATELPIYFGIMPQILQHSYIISWLDSVGLHIEVLYDSHSFGFQIFKEKLALGSIGGYNSRSEATEAAINQANILYNDSH